MTSVFRFLDLPANFGTVLLTVALILVLAPYLSGSDLGVFKVPALPDTARKRLRIIGPVSLAMAVLMFVPVIPGASQEARYNDRTAMVAILRDLVALEGGQGPIHYLLGLHCRNGLTEPTYQLRGNAEEVLSKIRQIRSALSEAKHPDAFVLIRFGTYRRLVLDLERREELLMPVVSESSIPTGEFCRMEPEYRELHLRLAPIQREILDFLHSEGL